MQSVRGYGRIRVLCRLGIGEAIESEGENESSLFIYRNSAALKQCRHGIINSKILRIANEEFLVYRCITLCAIRSVALDGGSTRATALSLKICPYLAISSPHINPLLVFPIGATSILTPGGSGTCPHKTLVC